jgi:tRNA dimethylallyltransferase
MGGGAHRPGLNPGGPARPFLVITGPTASGKSALALAIAREFAGVVINADSMQVYRELAILTSRPGPVELAAAPHRLYGVLSAAERCSAGRWREMALEAIGETAPRLAIVTGGTGLYLRALMQGLAPIPEIPPAIASEGAGLLAMLGAEGFHGELARVDPVTAARLHPGDSQRILRAWSVHRATGRGISDWQAEATAARTASSLGFAMMPPREALYAASDARFERMVGMGALEEVRALLELRLDPSLPAMKAVGVRELADVLAGILPLKEAIVAAQQATRRYAKRQMTWVRHQLPEVMTINEQFSERILPGIFNIIRQFLLTLRV